MGDEASVPASAQQAGSVPAAGSSPILSGRSQRLVYDGRLGELYKIFIVNVLLGLVTLGIYRFWGKTRMRRYLWSHLGYDGDRFEYTGTGGELFRGFLVVAAVLFVVGLGMTGAQIALEVMFSDNPMMGVVVMQGSTFLLYVVFAYLAMVGQYMALRYRLTRSRWRGIRGGLAGSPWRYGIAAFAWILAIGASLGFAKPVADMSLARMRLRNAFFGTAQARLAPDPGTGGLYGPYVVSWLAMAFALAVFYAVLFGMIFANAEMFVPYLDSSREGGPDFERMFEDPDVQNVIWKVAGALVAAVIPAWLLFLFARCWYAARLIARVADMVELAGLRPRARVTTGSLWRLVAGNMLISIFTLGLGAPIVLHRLARFTADRLELVGTVDGATVGQSQQAMPGRGEGLLEALDVGGAF
jgi:uncharacterized membrane protein YjgN (DUF898 family)